MWETKWNDLKETNNQILRKISEYSSNILKGNYLEYPCELDQNVYYDILAAHIINLFLEKNDIMYQLKDKNGITLKKDTTKEKRKYPVAVLINGASASASEILAAAIKESYGGFVVGTNSYGKGSVQQTTTLTDGSMIKYTVQNWLTPDGNWINEVGVEPTDVIEMNSSYIDNPTIENDNQLNKAIELLINKKVSN